MDKLNFLNELRQRIGGCFGSSDKIFAGHPNDETTAKDFIKKAKKLNITRDEFEDIALGYLFRSGITSFSHYKEQIETIRKMFK